MTEYGEELTLDYIVNYLCDTKVKKINTLDYDIPSDISSSAFFIVLTALSKNSELIIKNININTNPMSTLIR